MCHAVGLPIPSAFGIVSVPQQSQDASWPEDAADLCTRRFLVKPVEGLSHRDQILTGRRHRDRLGGCEVGAVASKLAVGSALGLRDTLFGVLHIDPWDEDADTYPVGQWKGAAAQKNGGLPIPATSDVGRGGSTAIHGGIHCAHDRVLLSYSIGGHYR